MFLSVGNVFAATGSADAHCTSLCPSVLRFSRFLEKPDVRCGRRVTLALCSRNGNIDRIVSCRNYVLLQRACSSTPTASWNHAPRKIAPEMFPQHGKARLDRHQPLATCFSSRGAALRWELLSRWIPQARQKRASVSVHASHQSTSGSPPEESDRLKRWKRRVAALKKVKGMPFGEQMLENLLKLTSTPLGSYVAEPISVLHRLDPRVKQAWLLTCVLLPARAGWLARVNLVIGLAAIAMIGLPRNLWKSQLGKLVALCMFIFLTTALGSDGVPPMAQPRTPPPQFDKLIPIASAPGGYSYVLLNWGPILVTRRGLSFGFTAAVLSFSVLESASLVLTTTTPEQLASSLRWYLQPLKRLGIDVDDVVLTLLLSLRFMGVVFDELRNLVLGAVARGVNWEALKFRGSLDVLGSLFGRLFSNLFRHTELIAEGMIIRGFRGSAKRHRTFLLTELSMTAIDWINVVLIVFLWGTICNTKILL